MEEAVCHALYEVIERDAVRIALPLSASSIPYYILGMIRDSLRTVDKKEYPFSKILAGDTFVDDPGIFIDIDISEIAEELLQPIGRLVKKFAMAQIPLLIKDITQKEEIGIPTFVASSVEWITHGSGYFSKGFGSHPDARIALVSAITEASQTRAINVHGAH